MEVLKILNKVVLLRPMLAFVSTDVSVRNGRYETTLFQQIINSLFRCGFRWFGSVCVGNVKVFVY